MRIFAKGIIKVSGTVSSFFDFENLDNWYVKLGQKEPREKRIQALAFKGISSDGLLRGLCRAALGFRCRRQNRREGSISRSDM